MKTRKWRILPAVLSLMIVCMFPVTGHAAGEGEGQQNLATAISRPYNGTAVVEVTDMYFAGAVQVDYERLSATAEGTLSSANAGTYTMLTEMTNIEFKERNPELYPDDPINWGYWYETPERMTDVPTNVTIYKADPQLQLGVSSNAAQGGDEITVTATLVNDYDNPDGLPAADQMIFSAENAELKKGTSVVKNDNSYSATFVLTQDRMVEQATFSVNISEDAVNYSALSEAPSISVGISNPADYSKVDAAIQKAQSLNRDDYKDFSAVDAAIDAVVRGKNSTEQGEVDAMARAIESAIDALEKKDDGSILPGGGDSGNEPASQDNGNSGTALTSQNSANKTDVPKTGDSSDVIFWGILAAVSAGVLISRFSVNNRRTDF